MTLEDALAAALRANPGIHLQLLSVVGARASTREAEDARTPRLSANAMGAYQESIAGTSAGATRNESQSVGVGLTLAWTSDVGTSLAVDVASAARWRSVNLTPGTTDRATIGPNYDASLIASVRQPLLRGAGRDSVLASEREARAAEARSLAERDVAVSEIIRDVAIAYWQLWLAERALEVQRRAETLAERQLANAQAQVEIGELSRVEALRFASELATLRETRRSREADQVRAQVELGRLLAIDPESLSASETPPELGQLAPLARLLQRAEAHSPQLGALDAAIEEAEQRFAGARNQSRARLDLVGTVGAVALWADDALQGLELPGGRPGFVAVGGLELELPLGNDGARRDVASAELEAARTTREQGRLALGARVRTAHEEAQAARERAPLVRETAEVANELAEAERARLELGTTTTPDLLEAQQDAREAELRRLQALVDATSARHRLEHEAGVLLDRFSLVVPDE